LWRRIDFAFHVLFLLTIFNSYNKESFGERMVKLLGTFSVVPSLPANLEHLRELAYNVYWSWNPDAWELFRRIDRELWDETNHNPIMLLGSVSQERLLEISHDDGFLVQADRVYNKFKEYMNEKTWFRKNYKYQNDSLIAYFSAEFGLTESLQTYSGGLGVLAGDHLKACSDLGIPLVGIGLLYKEGYFQQYLNSEGWQHERYEINDFDNLPMQKMVNDDGEPFILSVPMIDYEVFFQIWRIQIGRVPLYLLDTNIPLNNPADRKITETLYGGTVETRIRQEIVLGIGGIRALHAIGIDPMVCHMNEGHSAFLSLERMKYLMDEKGLTFNEAKEAGFYSNIFTTHTPVPAGIDVFSNDLIEKYLGTYYKQELKISGREFYSLGTIYKNQEAGIFNMAHLAMNTAGYINGVSQLHSQVSKKMWSSGYPDVPFNEIPIGSITNGVHIRSHISRHMEDLFLKYIGEKWIQNPASQQLWNRVDKIPNEELWRIHEESRTRLVNFARSRLIKQIKARGGSQSEIESAAEVLDPNALTIGFARRFATYKRATLLFRDIERFTDLISDRQHPVQFIFAGKAHPRDDEGKKLIQEIAQIAKEEEFRKWIVFLENYDLNVASYLVEGCDVWLNNPRRPLEASGTSGMKVIANGGLNFSVLDGWWVEGFDPELGWNIGNGEEYLDPDYQDEIEARQLYHTLENQIIPQFYNRHENVPKQWVSKIKTSMKKLGPFFNTHRMVQEYLNKYYIPAIEKREILTDKMKHTAGDLVLWKDKVRNGWGSVRVENFESDGFVRTLRVGENLAVTADIHLGDLTPDDVEVQLYYGPVEKLSEPQNFSTVDMEPQKKNSKPGMYKYSGSISCTMSGQSGYTIRILPKHEMLINPFELGVVYWAE
jgi:glycogen phosphorylase